MSATATITGRELRSYFVSPGGYVVAGLFMFVNSVFFIRSVLVQGDPASMRPIFVLSMFVFALICPAITMRAVSEELRMGTIEVLLTSPIRTQDVILGKFLAAFGFLVALLVPTLAFVAVLELYGRPDYGELACGYLGVLLAGAAYLASGILFSCLTSNQVVAYLLTFFFWLLVLLVTLVLPQEGMLSASWPALGETLRGVNPVVRLGDFAIGLLDLSNVVYFVSITAVLLIGAVVLLDTRRWR